MLPPPSPRPPGGIIHSYQKYDPREFPPPAAPAPDAAGAAFDYMLAYGSMAGFTPEQLAAAIPPVSIPPPVSLPVSLSPHYSLGLPEPRLLSG